MNDLQFPVCYLKILRGSGHYDVGIVGSPYSAYHREDIKNKKEQAKVGHGFDEELLRYT